MTEKFTTAGAIALKNEMPTKATKDSYDLYTPLDKKGVGNVVKSLLKDGGSEAIQHINGLGRKFFNQATEIGATTPLSDYVNDSDERQALIAEFDMKVQHILSAKDSKQVRNQKLQALTGAYNDRMKSSNLAYLLSKGSTAAHMANTGARGNPSQLASGTASPLMSQNLTGDMIPIVIKRSFAEGMSPAEHIALSYMGRSSTVKAQSSTSLPGALFKKLSPTMFHEVITTDDCHTTNGIMVPVKDEKLVLGRYLAETNVLVDEAKYKGLKSSNAVNVKVRSPMTCEAQEGTCQHCYGLWATGSLPEVGTNIGVVAAQSISEVLTQSMLSTKHKATVGERKGDSYDQASNLLNNPEKNFKDEATLSGLNGVVTTIHQRPLGDFDVYVNDRMHFVPISQKVTVTKGQEVKAGDRLSTGTINPRKLVDLRGLGAGRDYMAKELRDIYEGDLDPRHFEVVAKNMIKYVEVQDPGQTGLLPGEKIEINSLRNHLALGEKTVSIAKAQGHVLSKGVLALTAGTYLDANHIQDLKDQGVKEVSVTGSGLKVTPIVPGLQTAKMLDRNWISKLSFSRLRDTLKDSAATGLHADVHSTDPITAYTMGSEFGEGIGGRY